MVPLKKEIPMHLNLKRSQKTAGMMGNTIVFMLDARADLTPDEMADVKKYRMGSQVIYNSEASKKHLANMADSMSNGGLIKGFTALAMSKMSLNITIDSLTNGQHIEAKDLDEMLGAEQALQQACERLKIYLETASTFDGREIVLEF